MKTKPTYAELEQRVQELENAGLDPNNSDRSNGSEPSDYYAIFNSANDAMIVKSAPGNIPFLDLNIFRKYSPSLLGLPFGSTNPKSDN